LPQVISSNQPKNNKYDDKIDPRWTSQDEAKQITQEADRDIFHPTRTQENIHAPHTVVKDSPSIRPLFSNADTPVVPTLRGNLDNDNGLARESDIHRNRRQEAERYFSHQF
jgi:hypothetical protein